MGSSSNVMLNWYHSRSCPQVFFTHGLPPCKSEQAVLKNPVMVNCMCQLDWVKACPDSR